MPATLELAPPPQHTRTRLASPRRHAVMLVPALENQVRTCRRFTRAACTGWGLPEQLQDDAELVVSELATNAAQHGLSDMGLRLTCSGMMLHIFVSDHGAPKLRAGGRPDHDPDEHGRGLLIATYLCARIAVLVTPAYYLVHATLTTTARSCAADDPMPALPATPGPTARWGELRAS